MLGTLSGLEAASLTPDGLGMSNARLAILPGTTHYNSFASPALVLAVTPFLDAPMLESG